MLEKDRDIRRIRSQFEGQGTNRMTGMTFFRELFSDRQNPYHFPTNASIDQTLGLLLSRAFRFR